MWEEIYVWIESYAGCSYDMTDDINFITDKNNPFTKPMEWRLTNEKMIDDLHSVYDIITEFGNLIPDSLPNENRMKNMFLSQVLGSMLVSLNKVKLQLHIPQVDINDYNVMLHHIDVITDLIDMLATNTMDDIIEKRMFDKYNDENDDALSDLFGLTTSDLSNMHYTINSIREEFSDEEELD